MDEKKLRTIIQQGENPQVEFKECQDRISHYTALKHYPEIKVDEILSMIHSSRRTLYRVLADLRENGFVENTGNKNNPKWKVYNE